MASSSIRSSTGTCERSVSGAFNLLEGDQRDSLPVAVGALLRSGHVSSPGAWGAAPRSGPDRPDFPQRGDEVCFQGLGLGAGDLSGGLEPAAQHLDAQGGAVQERAQGVQIDPRPGGLAAGVDLLEVGRSSASPPRLRGRRGGPAGPSRASPGVMAGLELVRPAVDAALPVDAQGAGSLEDLPGAWAPRARPGPWPASPRGSWRPSAPPPCGSLRSALVMTGHPPVSLGRWRTLCGREAEDPSRRAVDGWRPDRRQDLRDDRAPRARRAGRQCSQRP